MPDAVSLTEQEKSVNHELCTRATSSSSQKRAVRSPKLHPYRASMQILGHECVRLCMCVCSRTCARGRDMAPDMQVASMVGDRINQLPFSKWG